MMFGAVIMLAGLPVFGGLLLWLTSRLEERVADSTTPAVVETVPSEPQVPTGAGRA